MDPSYLQYPKRAYGQDHGLYDWRLSRDRKPLTWDGGAKVALSFIVPLEFFPLNPSGVPFKHPGAMATPYPDLRHYTVRDYGNRVGVYRILKALGETKAGFAVNAKVAERYPPLMDAIKRHEIIAHGVSTDHIHHDGLSEAE
ncbi:MAG: polysaccharide deacetylase, partial [Pseudomonadota bacterium]